MDHKKAYILGLLVSGGVLSRDRFVICLPFKKWGLEVDRLNDIAVDILTRIQKIFNDAYGIQVHYEIGTTQWIIKPIGGCNIGQLVNDLVGLGLPSAGTIITDADLTQAKKLLQGVMVESFLSGIFDARCSLQSSHRRFTDDAPVVSIEVPGSTRNFIFVQTLCSWLTELGSTTDQVLYNHPNQHSSSDSNYRNWKKGFKIRFLVSSFLTKHSFSS